MRLTLSTECALHGVLFLAIHGKGRPVLLPGLARRIGVSVHTCRKVFQALAAAGVLSATRGINGGYSLGRDPSKITLQDIVEAVEETHQAHHCLLRRRACDLGPGCVVAATLTAAADSVRDALSGIVIGDLVESVLHHEKSLRWARV